MPAGQGVTDPALPCHVVPYNLDLLLELNDDDSMNKDSCWPKAV